MRTPHTCAKLLIEPGASHGVSAFLFLAFLGASGDYVPTNRNETNTGGGDSVGHDKMGGDQIHAEIGADAANVIIGKNISAHYEQPQPLPASHPYRQYALADVVAALIGDPLAGTPGLVADVAELRRELEDLRRNQYPRWFQVLMIALAIVLIALLLLVLMRVR